MGDDMQSQSSIFSRIGGWFKRKGDHDVIDPQGTAITRPGEARPSILRPFARRDQAISNLQNGFSTLTDLMEVIKDNLQDQNRRQDELLNYLSHLPKAIEAIPESNRVQGETLKAIHTRIEQQSEQQRMIADILNKVSDSGTEQAKTVENVREQMESMAEHERKISDNLSSVGAAMQHVSRNSQTSAQVLEQMRDNINSRDGELERILHRQAVRFTSMLAVAIFLSLAALAAVAIVGYQLLNKPPAPTSNSVVVPNAPAEIRK